MYTALNLGPLEEQVLLTVEPSLQPPCHCIFVVTLQHELNLTETEHKEPLFNRHVAVLSM